MIVIDLDEIPNKLTTFSEYLFFPAGKNKELWVTKYPSFKSPKVGDTFKVVEVTEYSDGMYGPQVGIKLRKV